LIPAVHVAKLSGLEMTPFSRIAAIDEFAGAHPAFAAAHPSRQPDA
jgi:maleylpyruvate isomerase